MILEEYISGDIVTLDGICDGDGQIRFLGSMNYVGNCMDSVNNQDSIGCFYDFHISDEHRQIAMANTLSFWKIRKVLAKKAI